jgi:hypothetical protein
MSRSHSFAPRPAVVAIVAILAGGALAAQNRPPLEPIDAAGQRAAAVELARQLAENYVFPELGRKAGDAVLAKERSGAYAKLSDPDEFAQALTRDLQAVTHDKHMRVRPHLPQEPGAGGGEPDEKARARFARQARAGNYGFREVKLLEGNVGYLRLDGFVPADLGGATATAAMNFLSGADALIFDLRWNGGGDPSMIQLVSSYLFPEPTHLNDLYWRKGDHRDQFWTLPWVPGGRLAQVPVYVLTSGRTFSAGEEFANNLKALKRATLVGETTGGGANPGGTFDVGARFVAFIPTGRAINPITGTNWEGVGVAPDTAIEAPRALSAAHAAALATLAAKAQDPEDKARLEFARQTVESQLHPYTLDAARLGEYAGGYGPRQVTVDGDALYYQREGRPRLKLVPIGADLFMLDGVDDFHLRFERDAAGRIDKVVGLYGDGGSDISPRDR